MAEARTTGRREAVGSWIEGTRGAGIELGYPGERLGLPQSGPGSVARPGIRLLAFLLDALMCNAIAWGLLRDISWLTLIFLAEVFLLTALAGGSAGQLLLRLRVVRVDGRRATVVAAAIRTFLLFLLVPALVWDRDQRGLHDKAAGTVLVRV